MNGTRVGLIGTGATLVRTLTGNVDAVIDKPLRLPPVIKGERGQAWLVDLKTLRRVLGVDPAHDASLAAWVVEAPWAHPAWHSYLVSLVHLRPLPVLASSSQKTLFYVDGATHEIVVDAFDPRADRKAVVEGYVPFISHSLRPSNFAAQFIEIADDLAVERVRIAVKNICAGTLNPDTDARQDWAALFGDNMMKDSPHARPPQERVG